MANWRAQFEAELKQKLSQKATSHTSEETVLMRAFRYFDLDNSGCVSFDEWMKAIEKIGVVARSPQQLEQLFRSYDTDGSGELDYREFTASIFGANSATGRTLSPSKGALHSEQQEAEQVLEKLRQKLSARGGRGILGLARQFKIMDDDNSKQLNLPEFSKAMRDFRVELSEREIQLLFNYVDRNRSGEVDYDEFLRAVRGPMNSFRVALVNRAFDKLDADRSGLIDITDIRQFYNAKGHPDVRSGRKSEDEVLGEFLETFEMHHNINGTRDRVVTREEFEEYYNNVSMSIDNDQYFELMMNTTWKLTEAPAYTRNQAWTNVEKGPKNGFDRAPPRSSQGARPYGGDRSPVPAREPRREAYQEEETLARGKPRQGGAYTSSAPYGTTDQPAEWSTSLRPATRQGDMLQASKEMPAAGVPVWGGQAQARPAEQSRGGARAVNELLTNLRNKLAARGGRGFIGLSRQFKIMDDNNSKTLDYYEFSKAMKDFRIDISEDDARLLYNYFDADRNGNVDYEEFIHRLRGEMNDFRRNLVQQAFRKLDKTGDQKIQLEDVKGVYNASNHPDVRSGKKTEDEILCEFLDTFEIHHSVFKENTRDHSVTFDEFMEYYNHISASIDDDRYFELMIKTAWNLDNTSYQKGWSADLTSGPRRSRY